MQADRFTIKSQEAVAAAQQLAVAHRNTEVAPAHLLLALLQQEDGFPVPVLRSVGVEVADLRARVQDRVGELAALSGDADPDSKPSSPFVKVLQAAERETASRGGQLISTE